VAVTTKANHMKLGMLASKEEPQYLIKSDMADHLLMHQESALMKFKSKR